MGDDSGETTPVDAQAAGLECPACGYNLTGLAQNRCPECGGAFDPEELRRLCSPEIQPATPWDRGGPGAFWATWKSVAFSPGEFARLFPRIHDSHKSAGYAISCYVKTAFIFILPGLGYSVATDEPWAALVIFPVAFIYACAVFAACICALSVGLTIAGCVRPTPSSERFHFWCGLAHYATGFFMVSGACGALAIISVMRSPEGSWLTWSAGAAAGIVFLWWCAALCQMVRCRSMPGAGRVLACLSIPTVGLIVTAVSAWLLAVVFRL